MEQQLAISDIVRPFNNKVCRWIFRLLDQARNKLAICFNYTDALWVLSHFNADNRVRILENFLVATFKDFITEQNEKGGSVVTFFC